MPDLPRVTAAQTLSRFDPSSTSDGISAPLLAWASLMGSISALLAWYVDGSSGLLTTWEHYAAPAIGGVFGLASLVLWRRPHRTQDVARLCLLASGIYFLGCAHFSVIETTDKGLYSLASNAQFMPLLYLAAFIAMPQGAAMVSWLQYASLWGLYLFHYGIGVRSVLPPADNPIAHTWFVLLLTHPCYILALHYITSLRGRLRQSERDSQDSKERFLAMLSHEIRSPLQTMLGSIDLLALKVQTPPEHRAIERLRHAAAQLDTHLRDVTEFTRLENPSWALQTEVVDMVALVREVCDNHEPQAHAKGLLLHCDIDPDEAPRLRCVTTDARRIRQILDNLITNALKYTPQGSVTVHVKAHQDPASALTLEVIDSGIGIPTSDLLRIFDPYIRLEDKRTAGAEGAGLGLAVVRRLVDKLGGQLHVDSQVNEGSCFAVTLPLQARQ